MGLKVAEEKKTEKTIEKCPGMKNEEIKIPKDILDKLEKIKKESK